mmetsp:Transcript_28786/g.60773  ORF Transcript_28786/g.60773 Transcript_28786/m.60773 type:complete len:252 (-) Transcript_28786:625-1380(-)
MTSKAIGITSRLILQPPPHHLPTIKLIPHHIRHRLRHHLIGNISIRRGHRPNGCIVRLQHLPPRSIDTQRLLLRRTVAHIARRTWRPRRVIIKEREIVRVHPENVGEFVCYREQPPLVRFGGPIGGIHRPEANARVPHRGTIELIVLTIRRERQRLELAGRFLLLLARLLHEGTHFGTEIGPLHGQDDDDQIAIVVDEIVPLGTQFDVAVAPYVRHDGSSRHAGGIVFQIIVEIQSAQFFDFPGALGVVSS